MKGGIQAGFTIIETLIVLATTGALLVAAFLLVGGKQGQTEFEQATNEVQSQIQQIISDVSNGYYPNLGNINCQAGALGPVTLNNVFTANEAGSNKNCIFLGKAVHFFDGLPSDANRYTVYTVIGRQCKAGGQVGGVGNSCEPVSSLNEAQAWLMAPGNFTNFNLTADAIVSKPLLNGLETKQASSLYHDQINIPANQIGTFAFISDPGAAYGSGGSLTSGQQQVRIYAVVPSAMSDNSPTAVDNFNANGNRLTPVNSVQLCLVSATTQQSGLINIGGVPGQLSVTLSRKNNQTCT